MPANPSVDALIASTQRFYAHDEFANQVFNGRPMLKWLKAGGRTKPYDGGSPILEPIISEESTAFQWQAALTEVNFAAQNGLSAAQFNPKLSSISVTLDYFTMWQNAGRAKVIDLWNTKVMQAKETYSTRLNRSFITGDGTNPLELTGLPVMVDSAGTYGNISRTTNTFWQSYEEGTAGPLNEDDMRIAYNTVSRAIENNFPNLILTTQVLFQKYESLVLPAFRKEDLRIADLGFNSCQFKGTPLVWDPEVSAGLMYFLNDKWMALRPLSGANFFMSDKDLVGKQLADGMIIAWAGQATSNGCRYLGKLTGRTA